MANKIRGERDVTLGDLELTLVPSFQRLAKLEAALDRSVVELTQVLSTTQRVRFDEAVVMYDVLARREGKIDRDRIGRAIAEAGLVNALLPVAELLKDALLGSSEENESPGKESE